MTSESSGPRGERPDNPATPAASAPVERARARTPGFCRPRNIGTALGRRAVAIAIAVSLVILFATSFGLGLTAEVRENDPPAETAEEGSRGEGTAPGNPQAVEGGLERSPEAKAAGSVKGDVVEGTSKEPPAPGSAEAAASDETAEASEPTAGPAARVRLPEAGTYRAPKILRLAGRLRGLHVVVVKKELNDVKVKVSEELAGREVGSLELRLVLARHSLFLHEFDHPKRGPLLVASSEPDWRPELPVYRKTIESHPRVFTTLSDTVLDEVAKRNAALPAGVPRYMALPVERVSKIFLWGPSRRGIEEIASLTEPFDDLLAERPRLHSYRGRHDRADRLVEPLLERLTEGERKRVRVSVARWNNMILFRAREGVAGKIHRILREIDRPGRFSRR